MKSLDEWRSFHAFRAKNFTLFRVIDMLMSRPVMFMYSAVEVSKQTVCFVTAVLIVEQ